MILAWLVAIPVAAGLLAWALGRVGPLWPRVVCLLAMLAELLLAVQVWLATPGGTASLTDGPWIAELRWSWIPQIGASFHLALDGLSLLLILLTAFLGMGAVVVSWSSVRERVGFFHLNLMLVLAGVAGVFLAMDLFLLYFFWELMLLPMYFLIAIWGHERRHYAATKFFIFTQLSGLLMFLAILALYFTHGQQTGEYTFDYFALLHTPLSPATACWLMLGFFVAFAVKLPVVPLHTWLPDAHTEAPTAGSVVLAGLLLKTGAYGMIRFLFPLFPGACHVFAPVAMVLGVVGILYGAIQAFGQTDAKRLVAYTSVSHLGFVLLGIFAWNPLALQGAVMQMLAHGLSTGALFVLVGALQDRLHTRDLNRLGGLWPLVPRFGSIALFFVMASLGLPGLGNFVGEFLVLLGSYQVDPLLTALATVGLVLGTVYALWFMQRVFFGKPREPWQLSDLRTHEVLVLAAMVIALLWLGLFPMHVLGTSGPALTGIAETANRIGYAPGPDHLWLGSPETVWDSLFAHLSQGGAP
jgi:NADH-quinone oxidoreductase subunit M